MRPDQLLYSIATNFTAGEWSPLMRGRVDLAKYQNGAEELTNWVVMVQGGAKRRPGFKFVGYAEDGKSLDPLDDNTILIPFIYSASQSYALEVGPDYIRFYSSHGILMSGPTPYELAHAMGVVVDYKQNADVLFILHSEGIHKLSRRGHTDWSIQAVTFYPPAVTEAFIKPNFTLTPGAVTGSGITFTASGAAFLAGDVGRVIYLDAAPGRAIITGFTAADEVVVDIMEDFESVDPIDGETWRIEGSVDFTVTTSGLYGISTITAGSNIFRSTDVGKYISLGSSGFGKITSYTSPTQVTISVLQPIESVSGGNYPWSMFQDAWYENNWPSCIALHDNRLILASTPLKPTTVWLSESGNFYGFAPGSNDSDGMSIIITADQADNISWLAAHKLIIFGTAGSEGKIASKSGDTAITPTSVKSTLETFFGCSPIKPVLAGSSGVLFVQAGGRRIRELVYNWESDSLVSPNMTLLSDHITAGGIKEIAFSKEPDPILWVLTNDGSLLSMTYERQEQVIGWCKQQTDGVIKRIICIPYNQGYEVWALILRGSGDNIKKTVEYMEYWSPHETDIEDAFFVDCGLTGNLSPPSSTVSGLVHLAGRTVSILADGKVHTPQIVDADGKITLDAEYSKVHVGLPYTSRLKTSDVEMQLQSGSLQGKNKSLSHAVIRFYKSHDLKVGPSLDKLRQEKLSTAPEEFSGDKRVTLSPSWSSHGQVVIEQSDPVPTIVSAIMLDFMVTS
jgi:hypothetical protein